MPSYPPSDSPPGEPVRLKLTAGRVLHRVHSEDYDGNTFNPTLADPHWGGGRFDSTEADPYGFLYASSDDEGAVCEALLRDVPLEDHGSRLLLRKAYEDRVLSEVVLQEEAELVSLLNGKALGRLGQGGDTWLVTCSSAEYGMTRRWAHSIRAWAPWAEGLAWRSRRDPDKLAYVFFDDRLKSSFELVSSLRLASHEGERRLREILAGYSVGLSPGRP